MKDMARDMFKTGLDSLSLRPKCEQIKIGTEMYLNISINLKTANDGKRSLFLQRIRYRILRLHNF